MAEFIKGANPDILSCLANLSSDEVFTLPELANKMLDMLPQEVFHNPEVKFLDPACKSGVFLREITKRLIDGLEDVIPDLQERIDHILHNQVYGIAITELTSYISRRSLYCSKYPNTEFSICRFDSPEGNISYRRIQHTWQGNKCIYCGASKSRYDRKKELESHAYGFLHLDIRKLFNMKFDVIISNPPYQLSDGGAQASAIPLYHQFVQTAQKLKPKYISMIIPSRWMTGGKGLDDFRDAMIHDRHITKLVDYANSNDCFTGVDIKGGVCYFLWERDREDLCHISRIEEDKTIESKRYLCEEGDDVHIRYPQLVSIKNKVASRNEQSFEDIVSARKPYGLASDFFMDQEKFKLPPIYAKPIEGGFRILGLDGLKRTYKYIPANYPLPRNDGLNDYKLFITRNYGVGEIGEAPTESVLAGPGELCTETFLQVGPWDTREEAENALSYMNTKFFRCLVGIRKQTQQAPRNVYSYVPIQDFSKPWTDEELYEKYGLTDEEIRFIEKAITSSK